MVLMKKFVFSLKRNPTTLDFLLSNCPPSTKHLL